MGLTANHEGTRAQGYFDGGWFTAVSDSYSLLQKTRQKPPIFLCPLWPLHGVLHDGRTILEVYPDSGIAAVVICGTGWQPRAILPGPSASARWPARNEGKEPQRDSANMVFGGYNKRVEHPRTEYDWLTRDEEIGSPLPHPSCGFTATTGLLRTC